MGCAIVFVLQVVSCVGLLCAFCTKGWCVLLLDCCGLPKVGVCWTLVCKLMRGLEFVLFLLCYKFYGVIEVGFITIIWCFD